eukprot:GSA25T00016345001.1
MERRALRGARSSAPCYSMRSMHSMPCELWNLISCSVISMLFSFFTFPSWVGSLHPSSSYYISMLIFNEELKPMRW